MWVFFSRKRSPLFLLFIVIYLTFSGCERDDDSFFDLQVLSGESVAWLVHSGDKTIVFGGKKMLLHTLSNCERAGLSAGVAVVCLVGYNKKPLIEFAPHGPFAALVDRENRTVLYMPLSLSQAAVGMSTLIAPLMFKREGCRVLYVVPEVPFQLSSVNTGEYPQRLRDIVRSELAAFGAHSSSSFFSFCASLPFSFSLSALVLYVLYIITCPAIPKKERKGKDKKKKEK